MREEKYLGLNFTIIPRQEIPYGELVEVKENIWSLPLRNREYIYNKNNYILMYCEEYDGYRLVTNDPTHYLPIKEVYSDWNIYKEYKGEN